MNRPGLLGCVLVLAVMAPALLACSSGSSLPEAPSCVAPTPTPTPRSSTNESRFPEFRYLMVIRNGTQQLKSLTDDWRLAWEEGKMSSRPEFREEFVVYAGKSRCLVRDLLAADSPTQRFAAEEEQLEATLNQYDDAIEFGLEAVRSRNVSEYRDFYKRVDAAVARLDEILLNLPQR